MSNSFNFAYGFWDNQELIPYRKTGVPVPDTSMNHGLRHTLSGVLFDSLTYGYGRYKLSIGYDYGDPLLYFFIDYTDCEFAEEYVTADVWIKFKTDTSLTISWDSRDFTDTTIVEQDEHPIFEIWDYKAKHTGHSGQNTDWFELYLSISTQNDHPYLTWNAYDGRNGNNNVDYYEIWKKESSSWSLKDTTSNTYYEDTSEDATAPGIKSYVYYKIRAIELDADSSLFGNQVKKAVYNPTQDTKVEPVTDNSISHNPTVYALKQNYPNPFNPTTTISFDLPNESSVQLQIFDIRGKLISTLLNEKLDRGTHSVSFNATDLPSGVYFYRLQTVGYTDIRRMLFLK